MIYRFRYRSRNAVGWSDYSPEAHIKAAGKPDAPPAPKLLAAAAGGVTLTLTPTAEDGGSAITAHKIFRDDGSSLTTEFSATTGAVEVTSYDGSSTTWELTVDDLDAGTPDDGLILGKTYRFVYVATNVYGDSAFSYHLVAGVGAPPQVTQAPMRDPDYDRYDLSTKKVQMMISWDNLPVTAELQVLGF